MCLPSRRKMERENASRSHLPQGIIEDILARLPVNALLNFRSVSKSWCHLIGSKRFIKMHLRNSTKNTSLSHHRMIFNLVQHPKRLLMHCSWPSLLNEPAVVTFKELFNVQLQSIKLVGCCNGLVCFLLNRYYFYIWNPSTKKYKILPDAYDRSCGNIISKYGFGYDESSNDYKVLVVMLRYTNTPNQVIRRVFSLKTNSWRTLNYEDNSSQHFGGAGKFVSGNLHWHRTVRGRDWEIVRFDLSKCEALFETVEQPSYSRRAQYQSLGVIDGCLSVFCVYINSHADIWVMKEYGVKESWVKVVTLPHVYYFSEADILSLLFFRGQNGEYVIFYKSGFLIYNPKDRVYRYSPICCTGSVEDADVYAESLVSVESDAEQEIRYAV